MMVDLPCFIGDSVFADLRTNQKHVPKTSDLSECYIKSIEFNDSWEGPIFTVVREELRDKTAKAGYVCHIGEDDFRTFFLCDFGHSVFTRNKYLSMLVEESHHGKCKKY